MKHSIHSVTLLFVAMFACSIAPAQVPYTIADGHADLVLSLDADETLVYLNTFPVDPGGDYIDQIRVSYGRVGGPSALNGLAVKILLYEDLDGGSPQNATLLWSMNAVVANGNTDTLNAYAVPRILVHGTLVAGVSFHNIRTFPVFIGALDTTAPSPTERSYFGFVGGGVTLDPANLGAIPAGQFMAQEDSGTAGNYRIEARGRSHDDFDLFVSRGTVPNSARLTWLGSSATYDVERATRADFTDGAVIGPGVSGPTYDDFAAVGGFNWFYRVH